MTEEPLFALELSESLLSPIDSTEIDQDDNDVDEENRFVVNDTGFDSSQKR